jgi:GTP-binding protein
MSRLYKVAIVGRPNVGKSSLFNRLIQSRHSIVEKVPEVTRDRVSVTASWQKKRFTLIDTGGLIFKDDDTIRKLVAKQVSYAIKESDLIIFLVDAREGVHPLDEDVAVALKKSRKNVLIVANKVDDYKNKDLIYDFNSLGFGNPFAVSAAAGINTGDLLDTIIENLPEITQTGDYDPIKIVIVGKPTAGKSSLFNSLLGEERSIVHNIAGTTRDAIDTELIKDGVSYLFIDTAGLKPQKKIEDPIEYYTHLRTHKAVKKSDIVLFVIDSSMPLTVQDKKIASFIIENNKSSIIICNKWDLILKKYNSSREINDYKKEFENTIKTEFDFFAYSPVFYVSALNSTGLKALFKGINEVFVEFEKEIEQRSFNRFISEITSFNQPQSFKGKQVRITRAEQQGVKPPVFVFKTNEPKGITSGYRKYIENKIRNAYGFNGTPVILRFKR